MRAEPLILPLELVAEPPYLPGRRTSFRCSISGHQLFLKYAPGGPLSALEPCQPRQTKWSSGVSIVSVELNEGIYILSKTIR